MTNDTPSEDFLNVRNDTSEEIKIFQKQHSSFPKTSEAFRRNLPKSSERFLTLRKAISERQKRQRPSHGIGSTKMSCRARRVTMKRSALASSSRKFSISKFSTLAKM